MSASAQRPAARYAGASLPDLPAEAVAGALARDWGIAGALQPLWGERDRNFALRPDAGPGFVVKVSNALEEAAELDLQLSALRWIARTAPDLPVPRVVPTRDGRDHARIAAPGGTQHALHVLTLLPGIPLGRRPAAPAAMRAAGGLAGRVAAALAGFFHPAAGHALFWDVRHIADLAPWAPGIRDPALAARAVAVAEDVAARLVPALARLRAQAIHHDAGPANVLVDEDDPDRVTGLVDFGDLIHGPVAQDAAAAALELATAGADPLACAAATVAGYDAAFPLSEAEIDLIPDLMLARAMLGLMIGAAREARGTVSEGDLDYLDCYMPVLDPLLTEGPAALRDRLRAACRFPPHTPDPPAPDPRRDARARDLLRRRHAVLGRALPLTYSRPLATEKGAGVWLYDTAGRPHLDAYNNVAHVGHGHPHVVRAVARQAAALNTNSRYLYENVVTYAERLGATMPGDLRACLFVNSGSEAVDLALRMAAAVTGRPGMIAIEHAYHGITALGRGVSPATDWDLGEAARAAPPRRGPDVALIENPDTVRGRFRAGDPAAAEGYAASVDAALAQLAAAGCPAGSFIVDCAFSSHGILDVPPGYLAAVVHRVQAAGGLVIADEVQYGFGRSGDAFWGFALHGVVPDIVTLGKPVANGISMGCVVTTPAILERFGAANPVFSTFGGNPVACAAAHAVLDVMEAEDLVANARDTGGFLIEGLRALMPDHPCIGDVRGRGFFIGVDIVADRAAMTPDGPRARAIKNHLREHGILVGSDGLHDNVLKIRPPMVFTRDHAGMLIEGLVRAAVETGRG